MTTKTTAKKSGKKRGKAGRKSPSAPDKPRREGERVAAKAVLSGTVTAAELSEIFGVTDQTLRDLAAKGMPKASRGRYPLRDASRWYLDTLRKRREEGDGDGLTRTDIARQLDLLKLKAAQGEVFDRRDVFDTMLGGYSRLGNALELLATRLGRELNLSGDDVKMVRDLIDEMRANFVRDMGEFIEVIDTPAPVAAVA